MTQTDNKITTTIHFDDSFVTLTTELLSELDADQLTQIQYDNLFGELVTVSAVLNKVGLLKARVDNKLREEKIDFEIWEADLRRQKSVAAVSEGKKLTVQALEDEVLLDPAYRIKKRNLLKLENQCDIVNSTYWAIQSKDRKLSVLLKGVTPEEFENGIIEGAVNQIMIKKHKKTLSQPK